MLVRKLGNVTPVTRFGDRAIDDIYRRLLLHTPADGRATIRQEQRDWLHKRNACAQRSCLEVSLEAREQALRSDLDSLDRTLRADVSHVGQCEATRIGFIGPRLTPVEGEQPDGASVGYADGVWQVSYEREPEVLKSRVDDPVRVCLVSKPRNCPPGDDRGRVYSVQNLRTPSAPCDGPLSGGPPTGRLDPEAVFHGTVRPAYPATLSSWGFVMTDHYAQHLPHLKPTPPDACWSLPCPWGG